LAERVYEQQMLILRPKLLRYHPINCNKKIGSGDRPSGHTDCET